MQAWPDWWEWELELTSHVFKRMDDREFNELDLRAMLDRAKTYRVGDLDGRWIVESKHHRRRWEVIVEPDRKAKKLVVVTAYPLWDAK